MKHPKFCIAFFMLFISLFSFGQSDFRSGYIITNDFDTITGQIDYRGDQRLAVICAFKESPKSAAVSYKPGDIFAYRFDQGKYFISKNVSTESGDEVKFLEYLVNGQASLYCFTDEFGDHYFIEKGDERLIELSNEEIEVFRNSARYTRESMRYIGVLKSSFSDCAEIQNDIENTRLSHKSLINITRSYHNYMCEEEECIIYRKEIPGLRVRVSPVIGMAYSRVKFHQDPLLKNMTFDPSWSPEAGIHLNFNAPRVNEKISIVLETVLSKNYHYGYLEQEVGSRISFYDAHLNTSYLNAVLAFKYRYPKGSVRPTFALGALCSVLVWNDLEYIEELVFDQTVTTNAYSDLPVNETLWGGTAELGTDFHLSEKFTLFCNLQFRAGFGIDNELSTNHQSISAIIGIYF